MSSPALRECSGVFGARTGKGSGRGESQCEPQIQPLDAGDFRFHLLLHLCHVSIGAIVHMLWC